MSFKERLNSFKFRAGAYLTLTLIAFIFLALLAIVPNMGESIHFSEWGWRVIFGIIGIVGAIFTVRMGHTLLSRAHTMRRGVSLKNSRDGAIQLAKGAVETLIVQGIQGTPGITNVSHKIIDNEDSISIDLTMSASSKVDIPKTMRDLQTRIKTYVNATSGINVRDVTIVVDKVVVDDSTSSPEAIDKLVADAISNRPADESAATAAPYEGNVSSKSWKEKLGLAKSANEVEAEPDEPDKDSSNMMKWFGHAKQQVSSGVSGLTSKLKGAKSGGEEPADDSAELDSGAEAPADYAETEAETAQGEAPSFADFMRQAPHGAADTADSEKAANSGDGSISLDK